MVERAIVISDTHGSLTRVKKVLTEVDENTLVIHCGDYLYHGPRNPLPEGYDPMALADFLGKLSNRIIGVRGNCDSEIDLSLVGQEDAPSARSLLINDLELFVTHGHKNYCFPNDRGLVISGHTHISRLSSNDGLIFLNPGSPSLPKDETGGSYGIIDFRKQTVSLKNLEGLELLVLPF
jgi:hypothetical protein|nr:phosphodiesterase [Mesotoga sp.]